ncbi:MAG: hypothetical protein JWM33_2124 [Caulobacteraceae bacterium]|nr:hypothetical protein [Caulobacteraceae bacterium]
MKNPARALLGVLLVLALGSGAAVSAPASEQANDGQIPDLVSELVVQAATPGPAWWKVSHDGAVVWILGTPPYLSAAITWDKRPLARRLKDADRLIVPVALGLQPAHVDKNGRRIVEDDGFDAPGQTVADLPPQTQLRLRALGRKFNLAPIFGELSIITATRQINEALTFRVPLDATVISNQLKALAKTANVPIIPTKIDDIASTTAYVVGPVEPKITCLEATMAVGELGPNPLRQGLLAWARGDLPSAMATVGCVGAAKGRVYQQEGAVAAEMIESDLRTPGKSRKSVAAVELIPLLMRGGVIERLKADAFTIEAPDSAVQATGS